jgi:hypothetical protein
MYSLHVTSSIIYYVIISLNMIYNEYNELLHKMTLVNIQMAMNKNVTQFDTKQHAMSWSTSERLGVQVWNELMNYLSC